eukprot:NODE_443_length_8546_cov_0.160057.p4 type:complete len:227 gc:universal NODE_443_length_8546_cov_0.160057:4852-4172(-)
MISRLLRSDKLFLHRNTNLNNPSIKFEFNSSNLKLAKQIISQYPVNYEKAAMIPLLDLAQRQNGFLSISCMNYVSSLLRVPPMRVYEVASFYTMFNREPIGKYHIQVCTTTPCELCGSSKIVDAIKKHLNIDFGETTKDKLFTLSSVECAGACVNAPVMAVNDDYFEDLNESTTISILDSLKQGKNIAAGTFILIKLARLQKTMKYHRALKERITVCAIPASLKLD